jgi:hypothetical protein
LLLFRSEEHVDHWCSERQIAWGAVVSLDRLWTLARSWYANRLDYGWQPRTPDAMEELFAQAGLTGDFWRVR